MSPCGAPRPEQDLAAWRVLVTGGSGFIGRHLVARLLVRGADVTLLRRDGAATDGCRAIDVDMASPDVAERIVGVLAGARFDAVFNLAAHGVRRESATDARAAERDRTLMRWVNVEAALALLAATSTAGVFIQAGSCSEYAPKDAPLDEDDADERRQAFAYAYGASKAEATRLLLAQAAKQETPLAAVRIFNVYGPDEAPSRLLPSLVRGLAAGRAVPLSAGTQVKDFLHVDDVTEGLVAIARGAAAKRFRGVVNLGSGEGMTVAGFARLVARALDADERLLRFGDRPLHADEAHATVGSTLRRRALTDWSPRCSLPEGVADAVRTIAPARSLGALP